MLRERKAVVGLGMGFMAVLIPHHVPLSFPGVSKYLALQTITHQHCPTPPTPPPSSAYNPLVNFGDGTGPFFFNNSQPRVSDNWTCAIRLCSNMGKSSKDKRDIYYRQGKSEGYRARSAYKLLHLDEQYGFLGGQSHALSERMSAELDERHHRTESSSRLDTDRPRPRRVVDLCAAPGSWSQVLSQRLGESAKIVSVDLQPMAPLNGIEQIIGDITTEETAAAVASRLGGEAQLIVCDGAPDVTGLHDLDEYLQAQLLLAALQITLRLLQPGGTFIAKIFRQRNNDTAALLAAQLRSFFRRVEIAKPRSSRDSSVEHFIVCEDYAPPPSFDRTASQPLLNLARVLKDSARAKDSENGAVEESLGRSVAFAACGDLSAYNLAPVR